MRIGQVADAVGLPTRTVRFYERRGLLPIPERAPNGYRLYDSSTIDRLGFIKSAQGAGLTLAEIGSVIDARDSGGAPCLHVGELLQAKLDDVRRRRSELGVLEIELGALLDRSKSLSPADCTDRDICHILRPELA